MKTILKKTLWFTVITTLCLVTVTLFVVVGCDKTENPDDNDLYFYAKVENASEFSNVVEVKLMGIDRSNNDSPIELVRGKWKDDGFTIVLPKTLEAKYLHTLVNNNELLPTITDTPTTMTIGDKNVKVGNVHFWGVDKDGNVVAQFYPLKMDEKSKVQDVFYTYVNSDITISGYAERNIIVDEYDEEINANILHEWKKYTTYSIEWKKGWNIWCLSSSTSVQEETITENWTAIFFQQVVWRGF